MAGERAGRHEIEQGSKFTLVTNQKTAKALSLTVPPRRRCWRSPMRPSSKALLLQHEATRAHRDILRRRTDVFTIRGKRTCLRGMYGYTA
jgi:hypothetical protein